MCMAASKVPNVAVGLVHAVAAVYALSQVGGSGYTRGGWIDVQCVGFNATGADERMAVPMVLEDCGRVNVLALLGVVAAASAVTHLWWGWSGTGGCRAAKWRYGNRGRWWFEYPVTAPLMAVVVTLFTGLRVAEIVLLVWACMFACVAIGGSLQWPKRGGATATPPPPRRSASRQTRYAQQRDEDAEVDLDLTPPPRWSLGDSVVAWSASVAPFLAFVFVASSAWTALSAAADPPGFVHALVVGVLLAFWVFPVVEAAGLCASPTSLEAAHFLAGNGAKLYLYAVYLVGSRVE